MTPQDKLTAFVQAMIKGGVDFCTLCHLDNYKRDKITYNWRLYKWKVVDRYGHVVIEATFDEINDMLSPKYIDISLEQLLCNPSAMSAAYGDGIVCNLCGYIKDSLLSEYDWISDTLTCCRFTKKDDEGYTSQCRNDKWIIRHIYIAMQAVKISHEQGRDKAIDYLYDNLKGGE